MTALRTKVTLFYDVISPYTWLAFEALCRYRSHWSMDLSLRPFFLAAVFKETGNKSPIELPAKALHFHKDLVRNSAYFGVPLSAIKNPTNVLFEKGTLKPQRFLTAINIHSPQYLEEVSRQLWMRIWSTGEDIVEAESLKQAAKLAKMNDKDIEECLKRMNDASTKDALRKTTEEALEYGAFGAPTIVVHTASGPEMFMGSDRFHLIAQLMNEEWKGPFPDSRSKL